MKKFIGGSLLGAFIVVASFAAWDWWITRPVSGAR